MMLETSSLISLIVTIIIHQNFIEALVDQSTKWNRNFCLYLASLLHSVVACMVYGFIISKTAIGEFGATNPFSKIDYILWGMHLGYFISDIYEMIKINNKGFIVHHIMGMCFLWTIFKNNYGGLLIFSMMNAESTAILINIRYLYFKQFNVPLPKIIDYLFLVLYVFIRIVIASLLIIISLPVLKYNYNDIIYVFCAVMYLLMSGYWAKLWWDKIKPKKYDNGKN